MLWQLIRLTLPQIQFVYLDPCVCLQLPSDSASRPTPLPLANGRRSPAPIPDFHRRDDAHAGRTKKRPVVRTDRPKKGIYMKKGGYLHHKRVWLNSVKNKITISLQERKRFH